MKYFSQHNATIKSRGNKVKSNTRKIGKTGEKIYWSNFGPRHDVTLLPAVELYFIKYRRLSCWAASYSG